jgi:hypothetical protein
LGVVIVVVLFVYTIVAARLTARWSPAANTGGASPFNCELEHFEGWKAGGF